MKEGRVNWRENEATLENIKRIIKNPLFSNCLLVDLLGGEPLLVDDLVEIVRFLSKRGQLTNLPTNGIFLADKIQDLKEAGISRINVSFYDENKKVLERDLEKINQIFPVHMSMVLMSSMIKSEADKIYEATRFFHDSGCVSLRFWLYRPMDSNPDLEEIIDDTNTEYMELRRRIESAFPGFCLWPSCVQSNNVEKRCVQLWQRISCDIKGRMTLCCGTDMKLDGENSNLYTSDPDVLYNHPTLVNLREQLLDPSVDSPEMCKNCNLLGEPGW
jgi:MoaA/NifB/PqqE/SkfB family radical SAM enzyme